MRHRRFLTLALLIGLGAPLVAAHAQTSKLLNIYVVDVEGGNATLFAAPSGQSVLIDSGNGGACGRPRRGAHPGRGERRGRHADRSSDHDALARRSFRRDGGACRPHSDQAVHRPRRQRAAPGSRRRVPAKRLSHAVRERHSHRRQAGRQDCDRRPRLAHRRRRRQTHRDPVARRRQAESVLRHVQSAGSRSERKRAVRRQHRHVRRSFAWRISAT